MSNQPYSPQPPNQVPDDRRAYGAASNTVSSANSGSAYAESQHESYVDPMGNRVEKRAEVFEDENQRRANTRYWVSRIIYFALGVLEVILLLRFLFRLLGANQDNGFTMFLYNLSYVFVVAFKGIFTDPAVGRNVFEISTIVAMLVYALVAWGLVSLGRLIFAPNLSDRQSITTTRRRHLS